MTNSIVPERENINKKIDSLLQIRRRALYDLEKSIEELYKIGLIFFSPSLDGIPEVSSAQDLLPRFEKTLESWEWKAIYEDGTELDQYGEKQHHFGDIDQSKLKQLLYISNFEISTSNQEKRAIVTLNWKEGTFDFLNCGAMDIRGQLDKPCLEDKKLILFKRKRQDFTVGFTPKEKGMEVEPTGEQFIYQRYYLGWETKNKKVLICLYPNGEIRIEENK